jgi:alkylation response protein AidB-like acyl-CoA dehydrogenase
MIGFALDDQQRAYEGTSQVQRLVIARELLRS